MALKPTIYKFNIALSDMDRHLYQTLNLTVAQHPSETIERMMVRVLVYCINLDPQLEFCKGLSDTDKPDMWAKSLDGQIDQWIDIGEPSVERIKKASHLAKTASVYSFNSKSDVWWNQNRDQITKLAVSVFQFNWCEIQPLAGLANRTIDFSLSLSENSAYISTDKSQYEIHWTGLQEK
ncbi:MAG: YaeQ family protein [Thiomicrospira sp.]|nr:YaeQ family protein [Thiomicrospira sp.]